VYNVFLHARYTVGKVLHYGNYVLKSTRLNLNIKNSTKHTLQKKDKVTRVRK